MPWKFRLLVRVPDGVVTNTGPVVAPLGTAVMYVGELTRNVVAGTELFDLHWTDGGLPYAGVLMASNGSSYGTTSSGGNNDNEVFIEITPSGAPLPPRRRSGSNLEYWGLLVICIVYLAQLWSPLRLDGDAVELLAIASSVAEGHGFLYHGQTSRYLPGYPAMVACLVVVHVAHPWALIALNAVFLFFGFAGTGYTARNYFCLSDRWAAISIALAALQFTLIKYFTFPLTDIPYLGMGVVAIALLARAESAPRSLFFRLWIAALAVSIAAVLVRPIGIALFPALLWSLGWRFSIGESFRRCRRTAATVIIIFFVVVAGGLVVLLRTKYVQEALALFTRGGVLRVARHIVSYRVHEAGELLLNVPAAKLGRFSGIIWLAGGIAVAAIIFGIRGSKRGVVEIYVASYSLIIFFWPYADTRFWTPIVPLLIAEFLYIGRSWLLTGWKRNAALFYAGCYTLMGLAALVYSTRITFSGKEFPNRFGDGKLRATYELFYSDARVDSSKVYQPALEALERFGR